LISSGDKRSNVEVTGPSFQRSVNKCVITDEHLALCKLRGNVVLAITATCWEQAQLAGQMSSSHIRSYNAWLVICLLYRFFTTRATRNAILRSRS